MKERPYQICTNCIMDTSDPDISFDEKGVCIHCKSYIDKQGKVATSEENKKEQLEQIIEQIKKDGKGREYDCISGVSGGVDSTYLTYMLKRFGLRVLVVHLDNGWNSELAVKNIENIVTRLGLDLYTRVLDWEEFRQLQVAYLKSSVLDLEALSDHAIFATLMELASRNGIRYIINGSNIVTEGILPLSWRYDRKLTDATNIKAIFKEFGKGRLKDFPLLSIQRFAYLTKVKKITVTNLLDYMDYNKDEARRIITEELDWRDYGGKHYESIITRFYQGYILPGKFGIDKRRAHLSTLVAAGQISREEALEQIKTPILESELLRQDLEYVPKKLGLSKQEFDDIMALPPRNHEDYPTDRKIREFLFSLNRKLKT
ncbi:MAG: N-acetyl sugar amidotransferase [Bacteroidia bacterium]